MKRLLTRLYAVYLGFSAGLLILTGPVSALTANPPTGDAGGNTMGYLLIGLGVSLVIIVVILLVSAKGRRR